MARIVQKFGGTSVADLDRIRNVAQRVKTEVDAGHEVAVVVSAMSGTTNQLVEWATTVGAVHDAREYDAIVATGEQVTVGLLAIALQNLGVDARSWLGWQVPIHTDDVHGAARIDHIDAASIDQRLSQGQVAIIAGFQGIGPDHRITTLGRGGSDTSALAMAAAPKAAGRRVSQRSWWRRWRRRGGGGDGNGWLGNFLRRREREQQPQQQRRRRGSRG